MSSVLKMERVNINSQCNVYKRVSQVNGKGALEGNGLHGNFLVEKGQAYSDFVGKEIAREHHFIPTAVSLMKDSGSPNT